MQRRKFRVLSAVTAGGVALAVAGVAASSGTGPQRTALAIQAAAGQEKAALAAQPGAFPPAILGDCPVLHAGYPTGPCVAQLQTDLNLIQGGHLVVDGAFGSAGSQTYDAVIAFQQAQGLKPDGLVGQDTKNAIAAALPPAPPAAGTPAPPASGPVPSAYAALGDSYSAGEGLAPYLPGIALAPYTCHRSSQAYSQYVSPPPDVFAACSGQKVAGLTGELTAPNSPVGAGTGLVTLTIGGNDLDWTTAVKDCLKVQDEVVHTTFYENRAACEQDLSNTQALAGSLKDELIGAYQVLLKQAPNAQVRVLTYPPMFPDRGNSTSGCRIARLHPAQFVIAADVEKEFVSLEQQANQAVRDAVQSVQASGPDGARLQLVDVESWFGGYGSTGHTVSCGATGRPASWVNAIRWDADQAAQIGLDLAGHQWAQAVADIFGVRNTTASFHPTKEGQHQMYLALSAQLPPGWR